MRAWAATRRAWLLLAVYLAGIGVVLAVAYAVRDGGLLPGDLWLERGLQGWLGGTPFGWWLGAVSLPGYYPWSWLLTLGVAAAVFVGGRRSEALLVLGTSLGSLMAVLLKLIVARPRPSADLVQVAVTLHDYGFPSGHVVYYVIFGGYLCVLARALWGPGWRRMLVWAVCGLLIALVGPSRVYLGAHWPSDVLAAYVVGALWIGAYLLAIQAFRTRRTTRRRFWARRSTAA